MYAWKPGSSEPEIRSIQKGFTWPYFKLSAEILALVDLRHTGDPDALQMYDAMDLDSWLAVDIDHVLGAGGPARLPQGPFGKYCAGFDGYLREVHQPSLFMGLCHERTFVREAHKAATPSSKRKAISPLSSFSSPVKRERRLSTPFSDHSLPPSPSPLLPIPPSPSPLLTTLSLPTLPPPISAASSSATDVAVCSPPSCHSWSASCSCRLCQ